MATSTTTMIEEMNKMMGIFSVNMSNSFNELNTKLINLDLRLAEGERQHYPKAQQALAEELEMDTKHIMEDAGRMFLKPNRWPGVYPPRPITPRHAGEIHRSFLRMDLCLSKSVHCSSML